VSGDALYQEQILTLAKAGRALPRLDAPSVSARVDNPICGDRVTVDFTIEDGVVTAVGAKVQGCALCQAATAVIADQAIGMPARDLVGVSAALDRYLSEEAVEPPWQVLSAFAPVRPMKSRRDCVALPFRAAAKAVAESG